MLFSRYEMCGFQILKNEEDLMGRSEGSTIKPWSRYSSRKNTIGHWRVAVAFTSFQSRPTRILGT